MAYDKYGWRPGKIPGPAKQIEAATEDVGSKVSENTIRGRLRDATELIDPPQAD